MAASYPPLSAVVDVAAAHERIRDYVRLTPVMQLDVPTPNGPRRVTAKLELLQHTGSFKARGAFNALLLQAPAVAVAGANAPEEGAEREPDVLACSGGNHGLAVGFAAARLGRRAVIFVPNSAARTKVDAMRRLGADVRQVGEIPKEAFAAAEEHQAKTGLALVHPYASADVIAGQGSTGLEMRAQAPEVRHWLVSVGGGGFAAGMALALEGHARIVAVEPFGCPTLFEAQKAGAPVAVKAEGAAKTSLGAPMIGSLAFEILAPRVDLTVLVTEEAIAEAQRWLWREAHLVSEPGGATALAALMSGAWVPPGDEPIGVVLCGSNADELPR